MSEQASRRDGAQETLADWGDFLRIRHELILRWHVDGKPPALVADVLSMDEGQAVLIAATPLGPRAADPRWTLLDARDDADRATYQRVIACLHRHGWTGDDANVIDTLIRMADSLSEAQPTPPESPA